MLNENMFEYAQLLNDITQGKIETLTYYTQSYFFTHYLVYATYKTGQRRRFILLEPLSSNFFNTAAQFQVHVDTSTSKPFKETFILWGSNLLLFFSLPWMHATLWIWLVALLLLSPMQPPSTYRPDQKGGQLPELPIKDPLTLAFFPAEPGKQPETLSFGDFFGQKQAKQECIKFWKMFNASNPDVLAHLSKGMLFYGPPGNGKTMLAKVLARETGMPFLYLNAASLENTEIRMRFGGTAQALHAIFQFARQQGRCIIFIDEIDSIASHRQLTLVSGGKTYHESLTQLLTELDGILDNNLLVIGATNRVNVLDPALLRSGRLEKKIIFANPNEKERLEFLNEILKTKPRLSYEKGLNLPFFAKVTEGFSMAELDGFINLAASEEVVKNPLSPNITLTRETLYKTFIRMHLGTHLIDTLPQDIDRQIIDKLQFEKKLVAYHEAGHAILFASCLKQLPENSPTRRQTFQEGLYIGIAENPEMGYGGINRWFLDTNEFNSSTQLIEANIITCFGGKIGEERLLGEGNYTYGYYSDMRMANKGLSKLMRKEHPSDFSDDTAMLSENALRKYEARRMQLLTHAEKVGQKLLEINRDIYDLLVETLLEKEHMMPNEVADFLQQHPVRTLPFDLSAEDPFVPSTVEQPELRTLIASEPGSP